MMIELAHYVILQHTTSIVEVNRRDGLILDRHQTSPRIDGPLSKEQAGARKAIRMPMFLKAKRYFEIEGELKADPSNKKLRKELAEHKKYLNYLDKEGERTTRLEALKQWRDALKPPPVKRRRKRLSGEELKPQEGSNS